MTKNSVIVAAFDKVRVFFSNLHFLHLTTWSIFYAFHKVHFFTMISLIRPILLLCDDMCRLQEEEGCEGSRAFVRSPFLSFKISNKNICKMKFIVQGNYHNQNFINKKNCIIIFVLLYLYYYICIICIIILLSRDFLMPVVVNGHGSKVQVAIFLLN